MIIPIFFPYNNDGEGGIPLDAFDCPETWKGKLGLILLFFGILFFVLGLPYLMVSKPFSEITAERYGFIKSDYENHPEARPLIIKAMKDGKVTNWEYNRINDFTDKLIRQRMAEENNVKSNELKRSIDELQRDN